MILLAGAFFLMAVTVALVSFALWLLFTALGILLSPVIVFIRRKLS